MVKSMTGYGRAVSTIRQTEFTVEVRSVNNRYLDCSVRLPRALVFAEESVKQKVKEYISRGKVDVFVSLNTAQDEETVISLNRPVLEGYLNAIHSMAADYSLPDDVSVSTLSRLPDVFCISKAQADEEEQGKALLAVTEQALAQHLAMRLAEGNALENDLRSRAQTILALVERVEQRSPACLTAYRERLYAKMRELLDDKSIDDARILTEAAIYSDKIAVDEETVRLRSHLAQLQTMLQSQEPIGRKLDFLMQEMNREANTIGSKCNDLELARTVVDIKAELEKIREQMQNIE